MAPWSYREAGDLGTATAALSPSVAKRLEEGREGDALSWPVLGRLLW